jgi:putative solute:sodium symporter small subunit
MPLMFAPSSPSALSAPSEEQLRRRRHWQRCRAWTALGLLLWALVSFGVAWNARSLRFDFLGWPFSFWWAAQGAMWVFLALVGCYAWVMHRLDREHGFDEED